MRVLIIFCQIFHQIFPSHFLPFHFSYSVRVRHACTLQVTLVVAGAALLLVAIPPLLLAIECVRFSALPLLVFRAQSQLHGANAAFFRKLFEWLERDGDDDDDVDSDAVSDNSNAGSAGDGSKRSVTTTKSTVVDQSGRSCLDRLLRACGTCCRRGGSDLNSNSKHGKSPAADVSGGKVAPITPREFLAVEPSAAAEPATSASAASATSPPPTKPLSAPTSAGLASKLRALSRFCAVSFIERLIQNYAPHLTAQAYWFVVNQGVFKHCFIVDLVSFLKCVHILGWNFLASFDIGTSSPVQSPMHVVAPPQADARALVAARPHSCVAGPPHCRQF